MAPSDYPNSDELDDLKLQAGNENASPVTNVAPTHIVYEKTTHFERNFTSAKDVTMIVQVKGVTCACVRIYSPVCGTDNKSYFNPCFLECQHNNAVKVQYDGNCIPF